MCILPLVHRTIPQKKIHMLHNNDKTKVSLRPFARKGLDDKGANQVIVRINGHTKCKTIANVHILHPCVTWHPYG